MDRSSRRNIKQSTATIKTWKAVELPVNKNCINSKWVKLKHDAHGQIARYKARLTAHTEERNRLYSDVCSGRKICYSKIFVSNVGDVWMDDTLH